MTKIMVVDDEPHTVEMLKDILENEGYEVEPAYGGADCIEKLESAEPDLILLDMKMPEMDGRETIKEIRRRNRSVLVIFLSAIKISPSEHMELESDYNVQGYLFKPITREELLQRIKEII